MKCVLVFLFPGTRWQHRRNARESQDPRLSWPPLPLLLALLRSGICQSFNRHITEFFPCFIPNKASQKRSKKGWVDAYTSSVEWPPPYASVQSYHPGGNHGQLFRPQGEAISDDAEAPLPLLHPSAFPHECYGKAAVLSQHKLQRFVVWSWLLLSHFRSLQRHAQTFASDFFISIEAPLFQHSLTRDSKDL